MKVFAFVGLMLASGPALALSCMRPDVATSYRDAADSADSYLVVLGRLTHDEPASAETMRNPDRVDDPPQTFEARIAGHFLNGESFGGDIAVPVTVTVGCVSVWCAPVPPAEAEVLAFVRHDAEGYYLDVGPCGGRYFTDPTQEQIDRVLACHAGGDCAPS